MGGGEYAERNSQGHLKFIRYSTTANPAPPIVRIGVRHIETARSSNIQPVSRSDENAPVYMTRQSPGTSRSSENANAATEHNAALHTIMPARTPSSQRRIHTKSGTAAIANGQYNKHVGMSPVFNIIAHVSRPAKKPAVALAERVAYITGSSDKVHVSVNDSLVPEM